MKKIYFIPKVLFFIICTITGNTMFAQVSNLSESFDNVVPSGWTSINHSTGNGQGWIQGDVRKFDSYTGVTTSYASASYHCVGSVSGKGTISNWLITPELSLVNGSTISFFTRTALGSLYPDRLEVRLSKNGASTNVGTGTEATGDFSTLLLSVNPNLEVGGYPDTGWTEYTISLSGISGTGAGRIALRYYVTDAGSNGINSNYIGIDEFSYETVLPVTLLNFTGSIKNNAAFLNWSTANETNNKGFEVELSHDNQNFSSLSFVAGHGTTTAINQYSFTDFKVLSGTNYYRLKQIDNDGNYQYSSIVKLDLKKFDWTIFGNPSANNTLIRLQTEGQNNVMIQVVSLNGQVIQVINKGSLSPGTYDIPLNFKNVSNGMYVVRLSVDKAVYSKKIIK
ncbi:MAG: choice-of-anchor J domain-containing protein [Parafilimonas sp.]